MQINLDAIPTSEIIHNPCQPTAKLFIDCGTHTLKAGFIKDSSNINEKHNKRRQIEFKHNSEPNIVFRNKMYKYKQNFTLISDPQTSFRTLFEKDVIINIEVLEATLDIAFEYLYKNSKNYKIEEIIFVTVIDIPKMFLESILRLFFEVYEVKKVQIGVDAYYSYLWNVCDTKKGMIGNKKEKNEDTNDHCKNQEDSTSDLVISFSHSNTIVYLIRNEKIIKYYKLPYGSSLATEYLQQLVNSKYNECNYKMTIKEAEYLTQFLRVSLDYKKESYEIYKQQENGEYKISITSKSIQQLQQSLLEKPKKTNQFGKDKVKESTQQQMQETNKNSKVGSESVKRKKEDTEYNDEKTDESNDGNVDDDNVDDDNGNNSDTHATDINDDENNEDSNIQVTDIEECVKNEESGQEEIPLAILLETPDNKLTPKQIKEKRRQKMIFFSSIYRYKQKIEKELKKIKINIDHMEETLEKTKDIFSYINKIKERYAKVKKDLKTRERIKRNLRNKKSQEYDILTQFNNGYKLNKIDEETLRLIEETEDEEMGNILLAEYQKYYETLITYCADYLNETNAVSVLKGSLFNLNIDVEVLRVTEVFFEPSLCGMTQPGLREIFEEFKKERIKNVLLTGGFSKIENLKERITNELVDILYYKDINVISAEDSIYDLFYSAQFTDAFKIYEKETYNKD
ncbi:Nuclear actin-protein involved in chromatin remodeling [Binucleata daphniae]